MVTKYKRRSYEVVILSLVGAKTGCGGKLGLSHTVVLSWPSEFASCVTIRKEEGANPKKTKPSMTLDK
jgi:hypothetical protein